MTEIDQPDETAIIVAFLELYLGDVAAGRPQPLAVYQARFPGFAAAIEREYHSLAQDVDDSEIVSTVGRYRLLEGIGSGGMGKVYAAEQTTPIERRVAVKLIRPDITNEVMIARFERERRILSRMDHPNIARVFDAGTGPLGSPYLVMELLDGTPLTEHCIEQQLDIRRRLELFGAVCRGVQHAHQRGVLHRDLKPSNILVCEVDGHFVPKIIDFGIAKDLGPGDVGRTEQGTVVGTPVYMSPEQALGGDVDTRTDVYALGVVLYELLCGATPFDYGNSTHEDFLRMLLEEQPSPPSRRATELGASSDGLAGPRSLPSRELGQQLHGDLDLIALTSLAKDRERRYGSPGELADDIARYLRAEPVSARPPTIRYRLGRLVRRHTLGVTVGAVALLAGLGGLLGATIGWLTAAEHLERFGVLARVVELERALGTEPGLWPATEHSEAMASWLERAESLIRDLPELSAQREALRDAGARERQDVDRFMHDTLEQLIEGVESFRARQVVRVRNGLSWAKAVRRLSIEDYRELWDEAIEAIAGSDRYGFELAPQLGLVPFRENPNTGLWEFVHLRSGARDREMPDVDDDGNTVVTEDTGIVFVLLPGGVMDRGAQREDRAAANYDPQAEADEGPVHEVEVEPFFLAAHELTQAQWLRLWDGGNPSSCKPGEIHRGHEFELTHPVETASWIRFDDVLRREGLRLPTEPEWEYGARADTTTPWSGATSVRGLEGFANIADKNLSNPPEGRVEPIDDGYEFHAPVGTYLPNAFGLHDMHGNVWEWCGGVYLKYTDFIAGQVTERTRRAYRGGGYANTAVHARCAARDMYEQTAQQPDVGARAARSIERPSP